MSRTLRLYTAENGELKHGFRIEDSIEAVDSPDTRIDEGIKRDRESRLLLRYSPEGTVRYYFYARDSGRPEQYIAEYSVSQTASREEVLRVFKKDLELALRKVGYEIDESSWESRALDRLDGLGKVDDPPISDDARRVLRTRAEFEMAVPDMEAALWLFNKVDSQKSVTVSEGGYLDHRGEDDVLIQVDSMRREVEPVGSTKEEVDGNVVKNKQEEFRDAYGALERKARSRANRANFITDGLRDAGVTERLGVEIYSKERSSEVRRRFGAVTFLIVTALSVIAGTVLVGGRLAEAVRRTVELGQPVYASGVEVQSWWVLTALGVVVLLSAVLRISSVRNGLVSVIQTVTPGGDGSGRSVRDDASKVVDALAEIQRRRSSEDATRLLAGAVPRNVAVGEGSRDAFRGKNAVFGAGVGAVSALALVGVFAGVLLFAFSYWQVFVQSLIVLTAAVFVAAVVGTALSAVRGSPSPDPYGSGLEPASRETGSADEDGENDDPTPAAMNPATTVTEPTVDPDEGGSFPWLTTLVIIFLLVSIVVLVYFGFIR